MAKFDYNDDSVVVIVGSGAGGGTLANELCQKGVKVVVLEAGKRQSSATFINDEWKSFGQLAWTDKRTTSGTWRVAKDFPELPAWICKTVGGTTTHWAGASLRFHEHEFKARTTYGSIDQANLLDWPITLADLQVRTQTAPGTSGTTMSTYTSITASNQTLWTTGVAQHPWQTVTTDVKVNNIGNYDDASGGGNRARLNPSLPADSAKPG